MTHTYQISGMTCTGCASTIERALRTVPGVESVKVDLQQTSAAITMKHHVSIEKLRDALAPYPSYELHEHGTPANPNNHAHHANIHHTKNNEDGVYYCPMLCENTTWAAW
jgi:Cu2+-exporting ATPase